jgi:protein tyrosine phosphatase (PTP) superfamily phosphohydrolase (DUF442 family)
MEIYWQATLDNSEHAETVRRALRQNQLADGPWEVQPTSIEQAWQYLTPDHQFHRQWQDGHAARGPIFVPLTRVDDQLWRGPQPDLDTLTSLQMQGLTAVYNLRTESELSRELCQQLGLDYHHIPVQDMSIPELSQVLDFLETFQNPRTRGLVHCFAGQGRTGLFTAAYRVRRGLSPEQAIQITNEETGRKGMRPCQSRWIMENHPLCIPSN